jgi:hypothetical protein
MNELLQKIPGLKQAIDRERDIRDQSFLDIPESLCGVEVKPLTLRKLVALGQVGSPFVVGGVVKLYHAWAFMVIASEARGLTKWAVFRKIAKSPSQDVVKAITNFIDETFQDSPPNSKSEATSYYSYAAAMVDVFASEYGWSEEEVLDIPLKRTFQYLKAITKRNRPNAILFNPSDKVRGKWLLEVNRN